MPADGEGDEKCNGLLDIEFAEMCKEVTVLENDRQGAFNNEGEHDNRSKNLCELLPIDAE